MVALIKGRCDLFELEPGSGKAEELPRGIRLKEEGVTRSISGVAWLDILTCNLSLGYLLDLCTDMNSVVVSIVSVLLHLLFQLLYPALDYLHISTHNCLALLHGSLHFFESFSPLLNLISHL